MKKIVLIGLLISFNICIGQIDLPGLIAYHEDNDGLYVYKGKRVLKKTMLKVIKNPEPDIKEINYSSFIWFNNKCHLLCQESLKSINYKRNSLKSNLVVIDINGNITDTIYASSTYEFAWNPAISPFDSKVVFTSYISNTEYGSDFQPVTLHVVDLKTKKSIRKLGNFCSNYNFDLYERAWSLDENRFVYSLTGWRKFNSQPVPPLIRPLGIYIYDVAKDEHIKVSDFGENPIWSPKNDTIAYIINWDRILFYYPKSKTDDVYYNAADNEKITDIHWSPDGEYILIAGYSWKRNPERTKYYERLIRVSSKEIVKHNKIGFANSYFSWRKEDLSPLKKE